MGVFFVLTAEIDWRANSSMLDGDSQLAWQQR